MAHVPADWRLLAKTAHVEGFGTCYNVGDYKHDCLTILFFAVAGKSFHVEALLMCFFIVMCSYFPF
jgi:hypothetical protein